MNLLYITKDLRLANLILQTATDFGWEGCKHYLTPEEALRYAWWEQPATIFLEIDEEDPDYKALNALCAIFEECSFCCLNYIPVEQRNDTYYLVMGEAIKEHFFVETTELPN